MKKKESVDLRTKKSFSRFSFVRILRVPKRRSQQRTDFLFGTIFCSIVCDRIVKRLIVFFSSIFYCNIFIFAFQTKQMERNEQKGEEEAEWIWIFSRKTHKFRSDDDHLYLHIEDRSFILFFSCDDRAVNDDHRSCYVCVIFSFNDSSVTRTYKYHKNHFIINKLSFDFCMFAWVFLFHKEMKNISSHESTSLAWNAFEMRTKHGRRWKMRQN